MGKYADLYIDKPEPEGKYANLYGDKKPFSLGTGEELFQSLLIPEGVNVGDPDIFTADKPKAKGKYAQLFDDRKPFSVKRTPLRTTPGLFELTTQPIPWRSSQVPLRSVEELDLTSLREQFPIEGTREQPVISAPTEKYQPYRGPRVRPLKEEFGVGLKAGVVQTGATAHSLLGMAGDVVGAKSFADSQVDRAEQLQLFATRSENKILVDDVQKIDSFDEFSRYYIGGLGTQIPRMAPMVLGGAVAGLAGLAAVSIAMETGEIYQNIVQQTGKRGKKEAIIALSHGIVAGALDALPVGRAARKMGLLGPLKVAVTTKLARQGILKTITKTLLTQGVFESITEGVQTAIERNAITWVDKNARIFSKEGIDEIINAMSMGALLGVTAGGAAVPSQVKNTVVLKAIEKQRATLEAIDKFQGKQVQEAVAPAEQVVAGAEAAPQPPPDVTETKRPPTTIQPPTARGEAAEAVPEAVPKTVQRIDEPGVTSGVEKPQGLFTSPADLVSPHADLGGKVRTFQTNPEAKVLFVDATEFTKTSRGDSVGQSGGVAALKRLLGKEKAESFLSLPKSDAVKAAKAEFPKTDWTRYVDTQEVAEGFAGLLARRRGFDAIYAVDKKAPEFSEYIGLTKRAFTESPAVQQPAGPPAVEPSVTPEAKPGEKAVATTEQVANVPDIEAEPEKGSEMLNNWIAERDEKKTEASIDARIHKGQLKQVVGESAFQRIAEATKGTPRAEEAKFNNAMHLYIDLKDVEIREGITPQQELETYRDSPEEGRKPLSQEQLAAFELSQNLPPKIQAIADQIVEENRLAGQAGQEAEVLGNYREAYIARLWEKPSDILKEQAAAGKTGIFAKFIQKSARQKKRTLHSVLDGWSLGKTLQVPGAIEASMIARQQLSQVIADRNFMKMGTKAGLFSSTREEGFQLVEHPNFNRWVPTGIVTKDTPRHSQDIYINEKGQVFERRPVYAFAPLAQHLNKILGTSGLYRIPGVAALTRFNAEMKAMRLFTSLFHHQAYIRSFSLASPGIDPIAGYKAGKKAIDNFEPALRLMVREGMTLGLSQDIEVDILRQKTAIGKLIDKVPMAAESKNILLAMRDNQIDILFNHLGPNLKAQAALLEFASRVRHNKKQLAAGKITEKEIARAVATALNNDFGGLNLMRIGRDPTTQHIFRLLALAPDWTESNIRSFTQVLSKGEIGRVHRVVIGRVMVRGMVATVMFNILMAAMDDEETFFSMYQKQWKQGRLRWLDVDITPIYKMLGGQSEKRKYFSLLGHFKDPIRWVAQVSSSVKVFGVPIPDVLGSLLRTAQAKQSILAGLVVDLFSGTDWMGKKFTTYKELLGVDDKGFYQTTREGFYREGQRKGGKLKGHTTAWKWDTGGRVGGEEFPSYLVYEARRLTPIQVDNLIGWLMGEMDTFAAITRSLGVHVATEVPERPKADTTRKVPTIPKIPL